jgi:hypothetical protein
MHLEQSGDLGWLPAGSEHADVRSVVGTAARHGLNAYAAIKKRRHRSITADRAPTGMSR